jgi:glycogen debranching enzyme
MGLAAPARKICGNLLEECYCRSLDLLQENSTPAGVLASRCTPAAACRHYTSIFGRDAAICALGMIASGESDLVAAARAGLLTLGQSQAANGQIPKYVKPQSREVDFWYSGCIDATLWWLIAIDFHDRCTSGPPLKIQLQIPVRKALRWLCCQEHQQWRLLQQNEASDWADIMPRSGFVLYTNALWYWLKKLYRLPAIEETLSFANHLLAPYGPDLPAHRRARLLGHYVRNGPEQPPEFYLSFLNFSFWGEEIDLFGNILAALTGICHSSQARRMARAILKISTSRPYPLPAVGRPLQPGDHMWRRYMERHRQNYPHQYHNGGLWPFIGGFWVLLLARLGMVQEAWQELERLAAANQTGDWQFNEWFHGETGAPMGMAGQSWNAALYVLAFQALCDRKRFIGDE